MNSLYDSQIAFSVPKEQTLSEDNAKECRVMVRSVLHDFSDWLTVLSSENPKERDTKIIEHQRYVHIRRDARYDEWISTQALHEITLKMRRIEKMFKSGIVKRIDLSDMFREIIPLGMSGRLEFFCSYYGEYDADCVAYIVMQTVVSCDKYKNFEVVNEFADYYRKHGDIRSLFENNRRVVSPADHAAMRRFRKLMEG